ncbi:MAG: family 43 glycosylhydrolase, partial [Rhodospirillales bacterium]|nr:family 43 glycosylhydrolase [Rhodospirillales bacterium]
PYSKEVWAPELHYLDADAKLQCCAALNARTAVNGGVDIKTVDGRWYIYVAASDGENRNHRSIVLEAKTDDPTGPFRFKSELYTGDSIETGEHNRWAIDATPLLHNGELYGIWSGWETDQDEQFLYIARMDNPWTISSNRVKMCDNDDYLWERVDETLEGRGLHEGAQILKRGDRVFVVYSCSGSWQPSYKFGMLELKTGGDPMNADDWVKFDQPVFEPSESTYGVGHGSFTTSPDGTEDWLIYHAKRDRSPGWRRAIFTQPFHWNEADTPDFGTPVEAGVALPLPSGAEYVVTPEAPFEEDFETGLNAWRYFGHHQFYRLDQGRLILGDCDQPPINDYRCGEKAIVADRTWTDFDAAVTVRIIESDRDAGLLFRVMDPAVGYDAQSGYFAGIIPGADRVILGRTDGRRWHEIAQADMTLDVDRDYRLSVEARGPQIKILVDGVFVLEASDEHYAQGSVGLRVVNTAAQFDDLVVTPILSAR